MHPADAHAVKDRGVEMIRKLLLPALAAALLGACATPYDYRGGHGDYYYGQPSVDYYDGYYGGYGGMWGYGGYGYGYGSPYYGYGYPYYGYGYPYYPPVIIVRPDPPTPGGGPQRPGMRPPGIPGQGVPSTLHGRGHPGGPPSSLAPLADERGPVRVPRFDPSPFPGDRIQREPRQPALHEMREMPRLERDDGLKPHH